MHDDSLLLSAPFSRTLSNQVADQLREAILDGRLKPDQKIVEQQIAEAMQLSRGPVRDALKVLEHERLVVCYPHRGAFVARLSIEDAEEIYSLREAIESLAVTHAVRSATDTQIAELQEQLDRMTQRLQSSYTQGEATNLDLDFHETLCRICGHSRVYTAWKSLRSQIGLLVLTHRILQPSDFRSYTVDGHRDLHTALAARDEEAAKRCLSEHIAASFASVISAIQASETVHPWDNDESWAR